MFFASDLLWALLCPSNVLLLMVFLGFLLGFRWRTAARRLVGLALVGMVLPALVPVTDLLAVPLETRLFAPNPMPERVDGVIVLGGGVDWWVSQGWGQLNTNGAGERIIAGGTLAERYPEAQLVFTGLYDNLIREEFNAERTGKTLFGGPTFADRDIRFYGIPRSTYEEALYTTDKLEPQPGETWLLVTSAWHMPRAYLTFQAQGWTLIPYPVDYQSQGRVELDPTLDIVGRLHELDKIAREWGALFVYNRLGRTETLLPEPTYAPQP